MLTSRSASWGKSHVQSAFPNIALSGTLSFPSFSQYPFVTEWGEKYIHLGLAACQVNIYEDALQDRLDLYGSKDRAMVKRRDWPLLVQTTTVRLRLRQYGSDQNCPLRWRPPHMRPFHTGTPARRPHAEYFLGLVDIYPIFPRSKHWHWKLLHKDLVLVDSLLFLIYNISH